jgi:2-amino-4-hydroxy-6-hydroxymethyldihydropteridine diphosphokinase
MTTTMHQVYLSLGSNMGNRQQQLDRAVDLLAGRVGTVTAKSHWIETKPWGYKSPNLFLNGCVCCETSLSPHEVLAATQSIERDMGRQEEREEGTYKDRVIDIDILLYDDLRLDDPDLKIPHPLMYQRDFVMKPLMEIKK